MKIVNFLEIYILNVTKKKNVFRTMRYFSLLAQAYGDGCIEF